MDVRQLLPQHSRHHRPLPQGCRRQRRHLRLHGRHTRHVAARLGSAGMALRAVRERGSRPAGDAGGRDKPSDEVHQHRPLRQCLQRRPHGLGLGERPDRHETRTARAQIRDRLALLPDTSGLLLLDGYGRRVGLRRGVALGRGKHTQDLPRAAAQGWQRPLHLPAQDRPTVRHTLEQRPWRPRQARRSDRIELPSVG